MYGMQKEIKMDNKSILKCAYCGDYYCHNRNSNESLEGFCSSDCRKEHKRETINKRKREHKRQHQIKVIRWSLVIIATLYGGATLCVYVPKWLIIPTVATCILIIFIAIVVMSSSWINDHE